MAGMCCVSCNGVSLTTSGPEHTVTDAEGRTWRFEEHHYCGPIVLRQDGEPKARQPGSRSAFWPAYEAWRRARREVVKQQPQGEADGLAINH